MNQTFYISKEEWEQLKPFLHIFYYPVKNPWKIFKIFLAIPIVIIPSMFAQVLDSIFPELRLIWTIVSYLGIFYCIMKVRQFWLNHKYEKEQIQRTINRTASKVNYLSFEDEELLINDTNTTFKDYLSAIPYSVIRKLYIGHSYVYQFSNRHEHRRRIIKSRYSLYIVHAQGGFEDNPINNADYTQIPIPQGWFTTGEAQSLLETVIIKTGIEIGVHPFREGLDMNEDMLMLIEEVNRRSDLKTNVEGRLIEAEI